MEVLAAAFAAHPERFVQGAPQLPQLPTAAWINKPKETDRLIIRLGENEVVVREQYRPETGDGKSGSVKNLILTPGNIPQMLLEEAKTKPSA